MIVEIPEWAMSCAYIQLGCVIMMFSTTMMNTHSLEWEWWHVIAFYTSAIVFCIVIPTLVVFKLMGLYD